MDILYLLIPMSAVLVLAIIAVFGWAVHAGQFDDLEREGSRLLQHEGPGVDEGQAQAGLRNKQSAPVESGANRGGF